ncbi:hypothetical protein ACFQI7_16035 [Paenibacillus allorhizosphaerae]|uniref:Uncharacterized protein n=1 Tax=Paenibacillus allorhizosphaerae TaxID=2849866 RepID=A0ABN7TFE3_9BACL|nr:hypothetical protein [Paenibacillus allorhizosphaerae]CAG7629719.1 hypothetical protein PAECIP111802_01582 [Paenibacillus allorhizosphaerae]
MSESWQDSTRVSSVSIADRLETVKSLKEDALELYEIAKDKATGEHYLHYAYLHRNFAAVGPEAGQEEIFHQLMPLASDDVLGIMFSDAAYEYPGHWSKPFLRNGPDGDYVWFDPSYADQEAENEAIGRDIEEQLRLFKQAGELSQEEVRKLLERLDRHDKE